MGVRWRIVFSGLAMVSALAAAPVLAADPPVSVELNRLEERGADCRAYLVLENRGKTAFDTYKLDLVMFDKGGVIARRLALEIGPLRAEKKGVKVFDLAGLGCADLSSILVNDVLDCSGKEQAKDQDCVALLEVRSRTTAKLTK